MEYTVINYLFDKGETVSEGICFTSQSKVTGLVQSFKSEFSLDLKQISSEMVFRFS